MPYTKENQIYIYKRVIKELLDEHYYDAMREFAWYTGYWFNLPKKITPIDRKSGAFAMFAELPYIEVTVKELKELIWVLITPDEEEN